MASTFEIWATSGAQTQAVAGSLRRVMWVTTAAASNGAPSENVTPSRSWKVQVLRSSLFVHSVVSTPAYWPSS